MFRIDRLQAGSPARTTAEVLDDEHIVPLLLNETRPLSEPALEIFRGRVWRRNISRKLEILRDTYTMLNAEAQAARAEMLEIAIVALILIEIVLAVARR